MKGGILTALAIGAFFLLMEEGRRAKKCKCKEPDLGQDFDLDPGLKLVIKLPATAQGA